MDAPVSRSPLHEKALRIDDPNLMGLEVIVFHTREGILDEGKITRITSREVRIDDGFTSSSWLASDIGIAPSTGGSWNASIFTIAKTDKTLLPTIGANPADTQADNYISVVGINLNGLSRSF